MIKKSHHTQTGFSLVETLVAITILMIVITGPMTISMATSRSTSFASEQVTAFFLAQEGAELAQKARDEELLPGLPGNTWSDFTDTNLTTGKMRLCYTTINPDGCGLILDTNSIVASNDCGTEGACQLYYKSTGGRSRYTHDSTNTELTPFTRTVKFTAIGANDVQVLSTVTWRTGSLRKIQEVQVETHLLDVY